MRNSDWLKASLQILRSTKVIVSSLLSLAIKKVIYDWDSLMCLFGSNPCSVQNLFKIFDFVFLLFMMALITVIIYQVTHDLHNEEAQQ